jgi:hypothetical protein
VVSRGARKSVGACPESTAKVTAVTAAAATTGLSGIIDSPERKAAKKENAVLATPSAKSPKRRYHKPPQTGPVIAATRVQELEEQLRAERAERERLEQVAQAGRETVDAMTQQIEHLR